MVFRPHQPTFQDYAVDCLLVFAVFSCLGLTACADKPKECKEHITAFDEMALKDLDYSIRTLPKVEAEFATLPTQCIEFSYAPTKLPHGSLGLGMTCRMLWCNVYHLGISENGLATLYCN